MRKLLLAGILAGLALGAQAGLRPHPPLWLRGEAELAGVAQGFGTAASPYILENLRIDAAGEAFGLVLENVHRPVILRNLEIYGASVAALRLRNVKLVRVENVVLRGSTTGLLLSESALVTLTNVTVSDCPEGIRVMFSREVEVHGATIQRAATGLWFQGVSLSTVRASQFQGCGLGLLVELGSVDNVFAGNAFLGNHVHAHVEGRNALDDGKRGNFWEGYEAEDRDGDGILDFPYFVGEGVDRFPLAAPPRP